MHSLGEIHGNYRLVNLARGVYTVKCLSCKKTKKINSVNGLPTYCNCKSYEPRVYEKGNRYGAYTFIQKTGQKYLLQCDCGKKRLVSNLGTIEKYGTCVCHAVRQSERVALRDLSAMMAFTELDRRPWFNCPRIARIDKSTDLAGKYI